MTRTCIGLLIGVIAVLTAGIGCEGSAGPGALSPPALPTLRLTLDGHRLRDALDREVTLRGVNAGGRSKFAPFFPFPFAESGRPEQADDPPFDEALAAYVARVAAWGLDVVRLPFSWEALEPTRGTFDDAYLERYAAMAAAFGGRGIRVVVDFHQDVFARPLCGDGFPLWALADPGMTPRTSCGGWFMGYLGDAEVDAAFDRFWANEDGLQDAFEAMWRHVAARLWPVEGVIGFEPINEPHRGSADSDAFSRDTLPSFFARIATVIREAAPGAPIFVDIPGTDAVSGSTSFEMPAAGGFVFAPHYYAMSVYLSGPDSATYDTDADLLPLSGLRDAWNVPLLLGEFGCRTGTEGGHAYLASNFDSLDRYAFHGTAWEYSTARDDWNDEGYSVTRWGGEETPSAEALVRAYPRAVSGTIDSFEFDPETREGTLAFAAVPGVTEIAAPARLFPDGVAAALGGVPGRVAWEGGSGLLLVETTGEGAATVTFGPRPPGDS